MNMKNQLHSVLGVGIEKSVGVATELQPWVARKVTRWTRFLAWLGMRSRCCYAKTQDAGYGYDQAYCGGCGNRCDNI